MNTWVSPHVSTRHFWGFTENQDFDVHCSSMSDEDLSAFVKACKSPLGYESTIEKFILDYYGFGEAWKDHSKDKGWICAQRRLGRALGWLQMQYGDNNIELPDVLILADDDTYLDVEQVKAHMMEETDNTRAVAACLAEQNEAVGFPFAFGGFGTFLNKKAIGELLKPITCKEISNEFVCSNLSRRE